MTFLFDVVNAKELKMPYIVECRLNGEVFDSEPFSCRLYADKFIACRLTEHTKRVEKTDDGFVVDTPAGKLEYEIMEEE
jgi:hypothetical protein